MKYLKNLVKTVCIDSSHKPDAIKTINWVKKDQEYTIIATARNPILNELMYQLAEVCTETPEFWGYKATRFAISEDDLEKLGEHEEIVLEKLFEEELTKIE